MSNKILCSCISCKKEISTNNLNKHYKSKSCLCPSTNKKVINGVCPYCYRDISELNSSSKANHCRWCIKNPKRSSYIEKLKLTNRSKIDYNLIASKISILHSEGVYKDVPLKAYNTKVKNGTLKLSTQAKINMSIAALKSNHQRVCKSTHTYTDKKGRIFKFDSSWEDALADRLDELNIIWDRPSPITYRINEKNKKYFPDFYLPEYDIYIDPKNSYCEAQQKEKLDIVSKMINLKILRSKEECKTFII
jgi:hypothetical protein